MTFAASVEEKERAAAAVHASGRRFGWATREAVAVLLAVLRASGAGRREVGYSAADLARLCGVSERTAGDAVRIAVRAGLVTRRFVYAPVGPRGMRVRVGIAFRLVQS